MYASFQIALACVSKFAVSILAAISKRAVAARSDVGGMRGFAAVLPYLWTRKRPTARDSVQEEVRDVVR